MTSARRGCGVGQCGQPLRLAGDALDIDALLPFAIPADPRRASVGVALAAVLGGPALDVIYRRSLASA